MERHVLTVLALVALTACEAPTIQSPRTRAPRAPSFSSATANQEVWMPGGFTTYNACTGDFVAVTGKVHASIMSDPSGVTTIHENGADLSGTSADGTRYRFIRISTEDLASSTPLDAMFTGKYRLVSLGSTPNFLLEFTAHIYEDSNGGFHADFLSISSKCVG